MSPGSSSRTDRGIGTSRRRPRRAAATGFTLVEILVVLIIVSLISGIVFFAFERVLDARQRLAEFLDGTDTPNLIAAWFRDDVDGIVPDAKGGADIFSGAPRRLTGLSVAPLNGMAGVPTRVTWEITFDPSSGRTYLRYQDADAQVLTIASWPEDRGNFRYCGTNLSCYETWPPPSGQASEVPSLIVLNTVKGTEDWTILAAPTAAHDPPPPPQRFGNPPQ